jgi:hypothetical protein
MMLLLFVFAAVQAATPKESRILSYEEQFKARTVGINPDFNCAWSAAACKLKNSVNNQQKKKLPNKFFFDLQLFELHINIII